MNLKRTNRFLLLVALTLTGCARDVDIRQLLPVEVNGVQLDIIPHAINVIASSPNRQVKKLIAAGGKDNTGKVPGCVFFQDVFYYFGTPESWNKATTYDFRSGEVIYMYTFDSLENRDRFLAKYQLPSLGEFTDKLGKPFTLYDLSDGRYAILQTRRTAYSCSKHPKVMEKQQGPCPHCAMDLVPITLYE